jgi:hypothetical protein
LDLPIILTSREGFLQHASIYECHVFIWIVEPACRGTGI